MVAGGDLVVFVVTVCQVLYFDSHYHAYVIEPTSFQSFVTNILDHNVYHSCKLTGGLTYISLKYHFFSS